MLIEFLLMKILPKSLKKIFLIGETMELVYIWIKNYKNIIVKQGLNFSGKFRFEFNYENSILETEIINNNYPRNFFLQTRILNLKLPILLPL